MDVEAFESTVRNHRMNPYRVKLGDWTWDQVILILGPVLLSVLLVALYAAGVRPVSWPALLVVVVLINFAGDIAFAIRSERKVKRGSVDLRNEVVGSRAIAEEAFTSDGRLYRGTVMLTGERWQAVSEWRVCAGDPLSVVGRHGLVLDVVPEPT